MEIKHLTSKSVTIISNGNTKAYKNSNIGRETLKKETNDYIYSEVLKKWGDTPLEFPTSNHLITDNSNSNVLTLEERITALEEALILLTE